MIIYFIIIGDILTSFANELFNAHSFMVNRTFYILVIAVGLSTQIFKREMHELKLTSILLFSAISLFVGIFAHQVIS
jgi:amino acid permease